MNLLTAARLALAAFVLVPACAPAPPSSRGPLVQDRALRMGPRASAGVDGPMGETAIDTPVVPWVGAGAVTRTTAEIMVEAARTPVTRLDLDRPRFRKIHPDRRDLLQNPNALPDVRVPAVRGRYTTPRVAHTVATPTADVATLADTSALPPDTMGDMGPTQYLVALNGRFRTINKVSGAADGVLDADSDVFFASERAGAGTSDPRVRYDRRTGRWFIIMINVAIPNRTMVAVSNSATIAPSTVWAYFHWTNTRTQGGIGGAPSCLGDYPTLGLDEDALYIGVNQFCGANVDALAFDSTSLYLLNKAALIGSTLSVAQFDGAVPNGSSAGIYTPQGVDNFDANTNEGYFVGVDNASFGTLVLRRVTSPAAAPSLSGDILVNVASTKLPIDVAHQGGTRPLDGLDDRLLQAVIRNGRLWTNHQIEVDAAGAATPGGNRNGVRWYALANLGSAPSVAQSGTVFDSAATAPDSYFMGAIMPNGQGHVALGMSRAGAASGVNAAVTGRLATDAAGAMDAPVAYSSNTSFAYNVPTADGSQRWGDYSYTSVDPDDDMTLWTLQQYVNATDSYAVRLTRLLAPSPATIAFAAPATVAPGLTGVLVTVSGSAAGGRGFFDPGPGFVRRLSASLGAGVAITNVVVNGPTSLTLTLDTVGAANGVRTLTVTNPDGQSSSLAAALNIGSGTNQPPAFGDPLADRTIATGGTTGPIAFTVSDPEGAAVAVSATSSNLTLIPAANVVLAGTGVNRTVTVTSPVGVGTSTITLIASDGTLSAATSFVVSVVGQPAVPSSPQSLTATVVRSVVTFSWQPPQTASEQVVGYQLDAGVGPGQTVATIQLGNVLTHSVSAPSGVFFVRIRARSTLGTSGPSNEIQVAPGDALPPLGPQALLATVQGTAVSLQWTENPQGPVIAGYQLRAGSAAGLSDLAVVPLAAGARTFAATAAAGTYFVRVVAVNAAGLSVASNEAVLTLGSGICTIPSAPTGLVALGLPGSISVRWNAAQSGAIPVSYLLQAGSVTGATDRGSVSVSGATTAAAGAVPAGAYFVRMFAVNGCGTSPASAEVSTLVP